MSEELKMDKGSKIILFCIIFIILCGIWIGYEKENNQNGLIGDSYYVNGEKQLVRLGSLGTGQIIKVIKNYKIVDLESDDLVIENNNVFLIHKNLKLKLKNIRKNNHELRIDIEPIEGKFDDISSIFFFVYDDFGSVGSGNFKALKMISNNEMTITADFYRFNEDRNYYIIFWLASHIS